MEIEICATAAAAAARAAGLIAAQLRIAIDERGLATIALSGGTTPAAMLLELAATELAWPQIHLFQVDERIVAIDDARRNLQTISAALGNIPIPGENLHPMPVDSGLPEENAVQYFSDLCAVAGTPPCLDVVHLGLGNDGHTASLFSGDSTLASAGDVAISRSYQDLRRMTLTFNTLNRARQRIWLVTGPGKQQIVARFLDEDSEIVATQVRRDDSIVVLDRDAAGEPA
jgi:6-phosphogluconolactonase